MGREPGDGFDRSTPGAAEFSSAPSKASGEAHFGKRREDSSVQGRDSEARPVLAKVFEDDCSLSCGIADCGRGRVFVLGSRGGASACGRSGSAGGGGQARESGPESKPESKPEFAATVPNPGRAPESAPSGMVWVTGGEFSMGAQEALHMNHVGMEATYDSRPVHRVYVDGFFYG